MLLFSEIFAVLSTVVFPIALAVFSCSMLKDGWKWTALGALCYVVFDVVVRLPVISVFASFDWFKEMSVANPLLYSFVLGLLGALCTAGGMFLFMRFFMGKNRSALDGFSFGSGYAMSQSVLSVGFNMLIVIFAGAGMANTSDFLYGGIERISMIIIEIAWAVLMMESIIHGNVYGFLLVLVESLLIYFLAVSFNSIFHVSLWLTEALLFLFAMVMLIYLIRTFKRNKSESK